MSMTTLYQPHYHSFGRLTSPSSHMSSKRTTASLAEPTASPKSLSFSIDSLVNGSRKRTQIPSDDNDVKRMRSLSPRSSTNSITPPAEGLSPFTLPAPQMQSSLPLPSLGFPVPEPVRLLQHQQNQTRMYSHHPIQTHHPLAHSNPFLSGSPAGFMRPAFDAYNPSAIYPWLLASRHPGLAGHFPGNMLSSPIGPFMLPYRKPKRIRTAFSPNQLLKLEQAFEKNHYVVGTERKQLAASLNLTETQVKVWYQNRRTKHKRQGDEDGSDEAASDCDAQDVAGSNGGHTGISDSCNNSESEEEEDERRDERREGRATFRIAHNNGSNTDLRTSSSLSDGDESAKRKQAIM